MVGKQEPRAGRRLRRVAGPLRAGDRGVAAELADMAVDRAVAGEGEGLDLDLGRLAVDILAGAVAENGRFVGDGFTYADANLVPILHYLAGTPEAGEIVATGALKAFMDKHATRPSVAGTIPPKG